MVHIKVTKGLDIPIKGKPQNSVKDIVPSGAVSPLITPPQIALNLSSFDEVKFKLLVKVGDLVKLGQPLAEDKAAEGRMFVSPAAGTVKEIRRGFKRALEAIVIDVARQEEAVALPPLDPDKATRQELIGRLKEGGAFSQIRSRPFNLLADPEREPRSIFVKAIESAPFMPPAELQVLKHEKEFQIGLNALACLTKGPVHLVYSKDTHCKAFTEAKAVQKHTAEGPHPVGTHSLHIQKIDRILSADACIWTLSVPDVVAIGFLLSHGRAYTERVICIAGPGVLPDRVGYFKARIGYPVGGLIAGRIQRGDLRFISGDPLTGQRVTVQDFLCFQDCVFCVIPENTDREFLHFFRLGIDKYTCSRAYLSGHFDNRDKEYDFTTNQHGEHRAFVDSTLYDEVMPLDIPTMPLVKAVMAEDYEGAEFLGLLEVDSEDFALPAFVCPSKVEMVDIMKKGLRHYSKEVE